MIRRLVYASLKLGTRRKSGENVEVEGVRGGSVYRQAKDKSKEKTCIQGGKQPVRKKKQTRKTKYDKRQAAAHHKKT